MELQLIEGASGASAGLDLAAWCIVYFTHALIWSLAAALLATRLRRPAIEHKLWKLALIGPLLSTVLARAPAFAPRLLEAPFVTTLRPHDVASSVIAWTPPGSFAAAWLPHVLSALAAVGLLRFFVSLARLARALRGRRPVADARLQARFASLCERMQTFGVRFTDSAHAAAPMVVGRREVCVPRTLLRAFSDAELDATLAHELAHIERGDGYWFPLIGLIEAVLWLQPLNHWLATRARASAELAADDRAVEVTRAPLELARALTRMAAMMHTTRRRGLVPALDSDEPTALQRVRRLVRRGVPACVQQASRLDRAARQAPVVGLLMLGLLSSSLRAEVSSQTVAHAAALGTRLEELDELARRIWELEQASAQLQSAAYTQPDSQHAQELEQALRHARATAAWKARSFE
jgi:beta-lactamase regulating signal transducer with metallopeptidase domain